MATFPNTTGQKAGKDEFSPRSDFMELCQYDGKANTLDVTFKSGSVYKYLNFFPTTYQAFKESSTHDAFFSKGIRGRFMSVAIQSAKIGRDEKSPLKEQTKRRTLNVGKQWQPGTLNRTGL